jgi:hypothetical protein
MIPAVLPPTPGERITTDRRDAVPLARLARSGALTVGEVPAMRALTRAREDTWHALKAAKVRLNAFWLRHARRATGRATGGPAPRRWRADVVGPTPAPEAGATAERTPEAAGCSARLCQNPPLPGYAWAGPGPPSLKPLMPQRTIAAEAADTTTRRSGPTQPRAARHRGLSPRVNTRRSVSATTVHLPSARPCSRPRLTQAP